MFNYRNRHDFCGSVLSFGAGTQSTAILLLMKYEKERFLEKVGLFPEQIIFANTQAENRESLLNLEKCHKELFPITIVENKRRNALTRPQDIPVYFQGEQGKKTTMNNLRHCTTEWKIKPINKELTRLYPRKNKKKPVALMLGISTDEITRMKINKLKSIENIYPLIDLNLSRQDCYQILVKYGWESVKSSCYMCPYQAKRWRDNQEIDKAIAYEKNLQSISRYKKTPYLHPFAIPLEDAYQIESTQVELWNIDNECDGVCGV